MSGWGVWLLNLAILALFAWLLQRQGGAARLLQPLKDAPPSALLLTAAGMLLSYGVRALRIYVAEPGIPRGRLPACLRLILINNGLNLLLPARTGEASFPILMNAWFGVDIARATGTLIWLRLLDLHVLATLGGACVAAGWLAAHAASALAWAAAAVAALGPPVLFAARGPLARMAARGRGRLAALAVRVLQGVPSRPRLLALDLVLSWLGWGIKLTALGLLLVRLGGLALPLALLGTIGGDLATVLPIYTPGGFGVYEAGVLALVAPGGAPPSAVLAAALDLHLVGLATALAAGALAWLAGPLRLVPARDA